MNKIPRDSFVLVTAILLVGPLLWTLHFTALYLVHALICATLTRESWYLIPVIIAVATLLAAAPMLLFLFWPHLVLRHTGDSRAFLKMTMQGLLVLSLIAVVWGAAAALFVPVCS